MDHHFKCVSRLSLALVVALVAGCAGQKVQQERRVRVEQQVRLARLARRVRRVELALPVPRARSPLMTAA